MLLLIGIADATYLTLVHYQPSKLYCPETGIINCEDVAVSSFSTVWGIPIAVGGMVWCVVMLASILIKPNEILKIVRNIWLILGLGAVLYSFAGQEIIGKICIYCMVLDFIILASVFLVFRHQTQLA